MSIKLNKTVASVNVHRQLIVHLMFNTNACTFVAVSES